MAAAPAPSRIDRMLASKKSVHTAAPPTLHTHSSSEIVCMTVPLESIYVCGGQSGGRVALRKRVWEPIHVVLLQ